MAGHEAASERRASRAGLCSFAGTARQLGAHSACCRPASQAGRIGDAPQARRSLLCGIDPGPATFSLLSSAAALQAAPRAGRRSRAFWLKLRRQWRRSSLGTRRQPSKARHGRYSEAGFAIVPCWLQQTNQVHFVHSHCVCGDQVLLRLADLDSDAVWLLLTRIAHSGTARPVPSNPRPEILRSWAEMYPRRSSGLATVMPAGSAAVAAALLEEVEKLKPSWHAAVTQAAAL